MDWPDEPARDLWVFGYGSLIWSPGFPYVARAKAVSVGWSRRLCIYSHVYRGAPERPGLVLGLEPGGQCEGVAFRVEAAQRAATIRYLRERELVTGVYDEEWIDARLEWDVDVRALTFVALNSHPQFAPPMSPDALLATVRQGRGSAGDDVDYVLNTRDHLKELGIFDPELEWLAEELRRQ